MKIEHTEQSTPAKIKLYFMSELLKIQNQIKHADWPFIIQNFLIYFISIAVGLFFFSGTATIVFLFVLSTFFVIVTIFHIYRLLIKESNHLQYKAQCIQEIYSLLSPRAPLPSMTGWAATPELAVSVLKSIQKYRPETIVEIGSGVTTLISAYSLRQFDIAGQIISLDHDKLFAQRTMNELNLHDLSSFVDLRVAPLENIRINEKEWQWYSRDQLTFNRPIDMLIIDGPPVKTQKNARYPAIPVLYNELAENAVIIIHDTDRTSESESIDKWLHSYKNLTAEYQPTEKGITIIKKGF